MENNKQPLLSVIIPMYNCAPVITRCLDSIDYQEAEIIVINDGSTDNGADIVRQYAITHPNVRLVNKKNGGVSTARNLGIEESHGKYISFVDADDFICKGGLRFVVEKANEYDADVAKFYMKSIRDDSIQRPIETVDTTHVEVIETIGKDVLMRCDIADYVVWDGIYRRTMLIENAIRFQTNLHLHEDDVFMGMVYCHAKKVISLNLPLYCYVRASSCSSTHNQSIERQRILINSSYLAAQCRSAYVQAHYPEAMTIERLKYMRWVKQPKDAIDAQLSLTEYKAVLDEFRKIGVWPVQYKYINVSYRWEPLKYKIKQAIKVWLINHPRVAYFLLNKKR